VWIKTLKTEVQNFKQAQQKDCYFTTPSCKVRKLLWFELELEAQTLESHVLDHTLSNIKHVPEDFLHILTQITSKSMS
jgi:hypothetical protein